MDETQKRIIEINGVKLEVDLSQASIVENYRVGDNVKVLAKEYSNYQSYPGVIIGFDNFEKLPTILIAYLNVSYKSAEIKVLSFNTATTDVEICPMNGKELMFHKDRVVELLDKEITASEENVSDLKRKKEFFLTEFGAYFKSEKVEA